MEVDTPRIKSPLWTKASSVLSSGARLLQMRNPREAIEALGTTACVATGEELDAIVRELVRLGSRPRGSEAWDQLAWNFGRFTDKQRMHALAAGVEYWAESCRRLGTASNALCRAAAARVAGWSDDPEVISELPALLSDVDADVSATAAAALLQLTRRVTHGTGSGRAAFRAAQAAVAEGVANYDRHKRREALTCALDLLARPAAIRAGRACFYSFLWAEDHAAQLTMRSVIRRERTPDMGARSWLWLSFRAFQAACADRLGGIDSTGELADVMAFGHLLANPDRRGALETFARDGRKTGKGFFGIDDLVMEAIVGPGAKHAPAFAMFGLSGGGEDLASLVADHRPLVRYQLVRTLGPDASRTLVNSETLADLCFDAHPRVAASSLLHLSSPAVRDRKSRARVGVLCSRLTRSPHHEVRAIASLSLARDEAWLLNAPSSRLLARRLAKLDRTGLVQQLRERLAPTSDVDQRINTILLAQRLGLAAEIQPLLIEIVQSPHHGGTVQPQPWAGQGELRVAATAVSTLARLDSPEADNVVFGALRHPDARVRANAVDALARRASRTAATADPGRIPLEQIIELKNDEHHRVRASAIRAEMLVLASGNISGIGPGAGANPQIRLPQAVLPMLSDPRPMHRVAGLWLAERLTGELPRLDADQLAGSVAGMIDQDASQEVRVRARRCAGRLLMRSSILGLAGGVAR